jgi:hypothetical protein
MYILKLDTYTHIHNIYVCVCVCVCACVLVCECIYSRYVHGFKVIKDRIELNVFVTGKGTLALL